MTCGQGKATRQVVCVNYSDHVIDRSECDPDYIPETEQDCSMSPCPQRISGTGLVYPYQNEDFRPRSDSPSRTHVLGGNQWRTGPWGAVSIHFACLSCLCLEENRLEWLLKEFSFEGLLTHICCQAGWIQWLHCSPREEFLCSWRRRCHFWVTSGLNQEGQAE